MATPSDSLTSPSIPIRDIQAHIILMRAIRKLQGSIQQGSILYDPQSGLGLPSEGLLNFLERALQRFGAWIHSRPSEGYLPTNEIPPLDVLMVWHTYMLSPGTYREDSLTNSPALATLGGMPWNEIVTLIDDKTGDFIPSQEQIAFWEKSTSLPFNPETFHEAYNTLKTPLFSIDLVKAILRQSLSLNRMLDVVDGYDSLEWITHAIAGYPEYMRLPPGGHVPPVEIDIIWHTHQLSGHKYRDESVEHFGHFIHHDDTQPPDVIHEGQKLMQEVLHKKGHHHHCPPGCCSGPPEGCMRYCLCKACTPPSTAS